LLPAWRGCADLDNGAFIAEAMVLANFTKLKGEEKNIIVKGKERVPLLLDQLFEIEREISANEAAQQKQRILGLVASMLGEFAAFICQPYR
jgi:hypothetical protein